MSLHSDISVKRNKTEYGQQFCNTINSIKEKYLTGRNNKKYNVTCYARVLIFGSKNNSINNNKITLNKKLSFINNLSNSQDNKSSDINKYNLVEGNLLSNEIESSYEDKNNLNNCDYEVFNNENYNYINNFSNIEKIILNDDLDSDTSYDFNNSYDKDSTINLNASNMEFKNIDHSDATGSVSNLEDIFQENGFSNNIIENSNFKTFSNSFEKLKNKFINSLDNEVINEDIESLNLEEENNINEKDIFKDANLYNEKSTKSKSNKLNKFQEDVISNYSSTPKYLVNDCLENDSNSHKTYGFLSNNLLDEVEDIDNDEAEFLDDYESNIHENIDEILEEHNDLFVNNSKNQDSLTDHSTEVYEFISNMKPLVSRLSHMYSFLNDGEYDDIFNELYIIISKDLDIRLSKYNVSRITDLNASQKKEFIKDVCYKLKSSVHKNKFVDLSRHNSVYYDNIVIENIYDESNGEILSTDIAVFNPNDTDTFSKFISGINKYSESNSGYIQYSKFRKAEDKHLEERLHSRFNILLKLLPVNTQAAIKLHIGFNGRKFEQREIAGILNTTRENISKKITAGYKKLKKIFAENNITYETLVSEDYSVENELKLIVASCLAKNNRDYYLKKKHKASNEDIGYEIFDEDIPTDNNISQSNSIFQYYYKNKKENNLKEERNNEKEEVKERNEKNSPPNS